MKNGHCEKLKYDGKTWNFGNDTRSYWKLTNWALRFSNKPYVDEINSRRFKIRIHIISPLENQWKKWEQVGAELCEFFIATRGSIMTSNRPLGMLYGGIVAVVKPQQTNSAKTGNLPMVSFGMIMPFFSILYGFPVEQGFIQLRAQIFAFDRINVLACGLIQCFSTLRYTYFQSRRKF